MVLAVELMLSACGSTGGSSESVDLQAGAPTIPASFAWFQGSGALSPDGLRISGTGIDPDSGTSWNYDFSRQ
jgi:hypothetical protein